MSANESPIDMSNVRVDPNWALRIPSSLAIRKRVIPCCRINERVLVACSDPHDSQTLDQVERHMECPIDVVVADEESLDDLIRSVFGGSAARGGAESR